MVIKLRKNTTFKIIYIPNSEYLVGGFSSKEPHEWDTRNASISKIVKQLNDGPWTFHEFIAWNNLPLNHIFTEAEFEAIYNDL